MSLRKLRHRLEYAALRAVMELAGPLPPRLAAAVGVLAGEIAYRLVRVRRRVVEENLALTLGLTLDPAGQARIARGVYHHLGRTLFEYGRFRHLDRARLDAWVEVQGFERVEAAYSLGRGVILVSGHFGNWELLGAAVSLRGYPMHFVAREQRNPYVDRFMNESRGHLGVGLAHIGPEIRRVYRRLKAGEILGMLMDQDAGPSGEFVDVLGRVASVQTGPAVLALRTGAPILPGAIVRLPNGRHRVVFEEPIWPDHGALAAAEVRRLVTAYSASLERFILRYPEQYYWVHRRWRTRPSIA
jgi:KDO2-lipid IV(A) lauroyltransferase